MQNFGVRRVTDFRNLKWSTMLGRVRRIRLCTFINGGCSSAFLKCTPKVAPWIVCTPSKPRRKSMCHQSRRYSPSVMLWSPTASWNATTLRMHSSSTLRSASGASSPRRARSRAAFSSGGRKRLPTWSARNGGRGAA
jgi:hypothetical protein